MLIMPVFSFAAGLVPDCSKDSVTGQCVWGFKELMTLINRVIKFILFVLVIPISAVMFAYAGFKMITSGGNTEARGTAKKVFTNTVLGLAAAAGAWIIIRTILLILGYDGTWIGL